MGYVKQNFKDGDILTASNLNAIENGIIAAGKDFNFWHDKTMVCVGDSITAGSGTTKTYWEMLKEILGLSKMTGMGVGGSCVSAKSDYGTGNSPLITRYKNIPSADLITIFMGTNDWGHETPLGSITDTEDVSFYGALNTIIPNLISMHPNARIIWITPMHRYGFGTSKILNAKFTFDHLPNGRGHTLEDYVDAIKNVCARWSIPIIDLYSMSGLHPYITAHKSTYMPDGLHPNQAGHEKMAYLISKWLQIYANIEITSTEPVTGVSIDINSTPLSVGSTIRLSASITPINANNKTVTWEITKGSDYVTISPDGLYCDVAGVTDGSAEIRVTTQDGGFAKTCEVNVTSSNISVTGVDITGEDEVGIGSSINLTAIVSPTTATNKNVSWLIVSGTEYVSIEPNGIDCKVNALEEGHSTISVTTHDGNYTKEFDVTVKDNVSLITLSYGNPYGQGDQVTSKARVHSTSAMYLPKNSTVAIKDNVTFKWALRRCVGENDLSDGGDNAYKPDAAWTAKKSYTTTVDGYWCFILLKADNTEFDWNKDSNKLLDYFEITQ